MAEVVKESLQYLNDSDINAIAVYLQALPPTARRRVRTRWRRSGRLPAAGAKLYEKHCVDCRRQGAAMPPTRRWRATAR
jgi:mono/diheme cytochrome c family protein